MLIDDISITMLDSSHPSIYKPNVIRSDSRFNREPYTRYVNTSTGDHGSGVKLPQIKQNNTRLNSTDPCHWTEIEFVSRINELMNDKVNQEKYMKMQEDIYHKDKRVLEDTSVFLQHDKAEISSMKAELEEFAKTREEQNSILKENLREYDNSKIITEMETIVAEDLRIQVNKLKKRHERLLRKEKASGYDQDLIDAYNEGKRRLEAAEERNQYVLKRMQWYDTEINKLKDALNPAKPKKKSKKSKKKNNLSSITENEDEAEERKNNECENVKLPPINTNIIADATPSHPTLDAPVSLNQSNNNVESCDHLPRPPTRHGGGRRFVRKYKTAVT